MIGIWERKMKIAFNMMHVHDAISVTGLGQHQLNILEGIVESSLEDNYIFIVNEKVDRQLKEKYPRIKTYNYGKQGKVPKIIRRFRYDINMIYLDHFWLSKIVKKTHPDIIFQPFNSITIKTNFNKPVVTTILDMYHRFFEQCHDPTYYRTTVRRHDYMFRHSHAFITSSEVNKRHIQRFYPEVGDERIHVIPVPISINVNVQKEYRLPRPFILCVNSLRYHKNIITLAKAYNLIKDKVDLDLVLVGSGDWDEANSMQYKSDRIHFTRYISAEERNYFYKNAELFVSPTLFEGFGMTPVEAMLFKKKVLVSDIEVMRESTFNSAFYFDDIRNEKKLADKLLEVLNTEVPDEELERIKDKAMALYAPKKIAAMLHAVFEKIYRYMNNKSCR